MTSGRIPGKLALFIVYIVNVNAYLQAVAPGGTDPRGKVLGMTTAELTTLNEFVIKFMSGDPLHPGYWDLHSNADTKNKLTRKDMYLCMKQFKAFFRPMLNRMSGSAAITNADRLKLNIADPDKIHTKKSVSIAATCFVSVKMLGGCDVRFLCRSSSDTARASKAEGSDAVEICYSSIPLPASDSTGGNDSTSKAKPKQLAGPSEAAVREIHTKAIFIIHFGDDDLGNNLQFFVRWINTKHPDLAGPWSQLNSVIIS
jgi:hypothetical protein